ncbi:hypothetical protein ABT173_01045 [Streptomyces sp. NPDC001795]|uniref:hypothetical protein n=1 Tax=Streptomyces sp. NPDC001795 TaxID=3154525 RepID=UPI003331E94E
MDVFAGSWRRIVRLLKSTQVEYLMGPMQTQAEWIVQIPWLVIEAEAALKAYIRGDKEPIFTFMVTRLKLRRPTDDHAQALALALLAQDWKRTADHRDPRAVRLALRSLVNAGEDWEANHQIAGGRIASLDDLQSRLLIHPSCREAGPEAIVIANVVPWAEHFDSRDVRHAVARLNETETAVTRTWAEDTYPNWREAAMLHQQKAPEFSDRVRRKLRRSGKEMARRRSLRDQEEK